MRIIKELMEIWPNEVCDILIGLQQNTLYSKSNQHVTRLLQQFLSYWDQIFLPSFHLFNNYSQFLFCHPLNHVLLSHFVNNYSECPVW